MPVRATRINPVDNVAIVTADVSEGELVRVDGGIELRSTEAVPRGGKIALSPIPAGKAVLRYGEEIGVALTDIAAGQHVHTHNLGGGK
ncbi:MAG: UxaA family hydrolase [Dehalococcoidia bacterium]|nr:UxaA family hydrolase [Dehalococcoidia bacterium]